MPFGNFWCVVYLKRSSDWSYAIDIHTICVLLCFVLGLVPVELSHTLQGYFTCIGAIVMGQRPPVKQSHNMGKYIIRIQSEQNSAQQNRAQVLWPTLQCRASFQLIAAPLGEYHNTCKFSQNRLNRRVEQCQPAFECLVRFIQRNATP